MYKSGYIKKCISAAVILLVMEFLYINCTPGISGTSEVGNPSVSATITDRNGKPQKNIPVVLLPENFNIAKTSDLSRFSKDITDSDGHVELPIMGKDSIYNVTSTDSIYRYQLLKRVSKYDSVNINNNSLSLGAITLQEPGIIQITIDSASFRKGSVITIPGTTISYSVNAPGIYEFKSPAGILNINYYSTAPQPEQPAGKNISSVNVMSNDTIKITTNSVITKKKYDTTLTSDTLIKYINSIESCDTIRICDSIHNTDSLFLYDTVISYDTITRFDTLRHTPASSTVMVDTILYRDTLVKLDTVHTGDSVSILSTTTFISRIIEQKYTKYIDTLLIRMTLLYQSSVKIKKHLLINDSIISPGYSLIFRHIDSISSIIYFDTLHIVSSYMTFDTTMSSDTLRYSDTIVQIYSKTVFDTTRLSDTSSMKDTLKFNNSILQPFTTTTMNDSTVFIDTITQYAYISRFDTTILKDSLSVQIDTIIQYQLSTSYDTIWIPVTYYDFHSDSSNPEFALSMMAVEKFKTASTELDTAYLPEAGVTTFFNYYIKYWFRDFNSPGGAKNDYMSPVYNAKDETSTGDLIELIRVNHDTSFKNIVIKGSIPFIRNTQLGNTYTFASQNFYPIDNMGFGNEGLDHNYSFTMTFTLIYPPQAKECNIAITASDETWVYAENKQIIDIGGIQKATSKKSTIGTSNMQRNIRVFHSVRNTILSSFDFSFDLY